MQFLRYWGCVLWTAFRHSFLTSEHVLMGMVIVVGLVGWEWPQIERVIEGQHVDIHGWQATALALLGVFGARLLLAPYWMHQEQATKVRRLEAALKSKMSKKEIREQIGKFLEQGKMLLVAMDKEGLFPEREIGQWDDEVKEWLNANLDTSYGAAFRNPKTHPPAPTGMRKQIRDTWVAVRFRTDNLREFLEEFK